MICIIQYNIQSLIKRLDKQNPAFLQYIVTSLICANEWLQKEPCIVSYSDIFYETSGEEIRSQMYSFIDGSGKEKCLRPDMTIPTCQSFIKSDDKIIIN